MDLYTLLIEISSDSGVGPYTEKRKVCNCHYKDGEWWKEGKKVTNKFHTGSGDCIVKILEFKGQSFWYY